MFYKTIEVLYLLLKHSNDSAQNIFITVTTNLVFILITLVQN